MFASFVQSNTQLRKKTTTQFEQDCVNQFIISEFEKSANQKGVD